MVQSSTASYPARSPKMCWRGAASNVRSRKMRPPTEAAAGLDAVVAPQ